LTGEQCVKNCQSLTSPYSNVSFRMPSLRQIVATQLHSHQRNEAGTDRHQQNETADMCLQCASSSIRRHIHIWLLRQCAICKDWSRSGLPYSNNADIHKNFFDMALNSLFCAYLPLPLSNYSLLLWHVWFATFSKTLKS